MSKHYRIHTWADGFGRWHAEVFFEPHTATYSPRINAGITAAKRAIRAEINARVNQHDYRLRYHQVSEDSGDGLIRSITIAEG